MTRRGWLAALIAGFGAGLAGGLFGVGGGIVLVPVLTGFFRLTQHEAHGTSLAAVGATAISGAVVYALAGHVAWVPAGLMALASVFTSRLGARLAARTSRRALMTAFGLFLLAVAVRILLRVPAGSGQLAAGHALAGAWGVVAGLGVGAAAGLLAGYMGVGGGVIAVPALTLLFGLSQQTAQGTSLALILVTAPFGAVEHARHGNVARDVLPGLLIGALFGAPIASILAQRMPQATLARAFAIFLIANGLRLTWSAFRPAPAARA